MAIGTVDSALDGTTYATNSDSLKRAVEPAYIKFLQEVRSSVQHHKNPFIAIHAHDSAELIAELCGNGKLSKMAAWDDGDTIELIADCFDTGRRLELMFCGDGVHWVTITQVSQDGVREFAPATRPFEFLLKLHVGWLIGG